MSKAEELLNSLVEAYAAESDPSSDSHIVIGADRFITIPDELKRIAVQYDHNMRTVTFDCPRYYDGRDMSKMTVYINIRGPKGAPHSYIADNVRVDTSNPNVMHFDWTIRRPLTDVKGNLVFLVCIRKADAEGNEENHWNSELNTDLYISEGMEYGEFEEYPYSDIVTQLLQRMDDVEDLATPEAMQGYANAWLEENSDDVLAEIQAKVSADNRTKADAIIRTVEGESIAVSDSSDDYLRGLRVFGKTTQVKTTGKNLLNNTAETVTIEGITYTINDDGSIVANGTATADSFLTIGSVNYVGGVTYKISGCPINGSDTTYMLYAVYGANLYAFDTGYGFTFTPESDMTKTVSIKIIKGVTVTNLLFHPMIHLASITDGTYEPYSGGVASPSPDWPQELVSIENPSVGVFGNNLLDQHAAYVATGNTAEIVKVVNESSLVLTGTPSKNYVQITTGYLTMPITWRGLALRFGGIITGNQPHVVLYFRNSSKAIIAQVGFSESGEKTITVPYEAAYYEFAFCLNRTTTGSAFTATYENLYLINADVDGSYELYKTMQQLAIARTLHAIPVSQNGNYTDVNGQQWICDEVDFERGVHVQRVIKLNNNEPTNVLVSLKNTKTIKCVCDHSLVGKGNGTGLCDVTSRYEYSTNDLVHYYVEDKAAMIFIPVDYDYVANPVTVLAQLVTPIETPLTATELQAFKYLRSNHPNTTVINDSGAWMEMKYNADTKIYIDSIIRANIGNVPVTDEQISTAVSDYLDKHPVTSGSTATIGTAELLASDWVQSELSERLHYQKDVTISGVPENFDFENCQVDLTPSVEQLLVFYEKDLTFVTENEDAIITVYAIGQKPEHDYTIQVTITEVSV